MLVSQIVRVSMHDYSLACLEQLLPSIASEAETLELIQAELLSIDLRKGMHRGLIGQRALVVGELNQSLSGRLRGAWHGDDSLAVLQGLGDVEEEIAQDWPVPLQLLDRYDQNIDFRTFGSRSPWGQQDVPPSAQPGMIASRIELTAEVTARLRAAAAAVAAVRYHTATGNWPETLEALVPEHLAEVPLDPCTGEPLRLARTNTELRFYSVGVDRVDDGGQELPTESPDGPQVRQGEPDVVFRVPLDLSEHSSGQ
ncbi:hypothetical protein [Aeoliella mucimassa]|nr:hypothetical protein [Aeoliella mucimassa]